jgi:hypothetical protein
MEARFEDFLLRFDLGLSEAISNEQVETGRATLVGFTLALRLKLYIVCRQL